MAAMMTKSWTTKCGLAFQTAVHHVDDLALAQYETSRDAVIFAIDVSGRMLEASAGRSRSRSADGEPERKRRKTDKSSVLAAFEAILKLMKKKIIANPKDMVGIVLFNTVRSHILVQSVR
jgi:ATP-dependent DNA helicase 2 subunit 1